MDEWVVLVGNVDDQRIAVRVPPGRPYKHQKTRSLSTDSLSESEVLFMVLYGKGGGFRNKPYPLDIAIILRAIGEDGSGSSVSGVADSIRQELSEFESAYTMQVETFNDREWVAVSGEYGGSYSSPFSEDYCLSIYYGFDQKIRQDSPWRRNWEAVIIDVVKSTLISEATTVR